MKPLNQISISALKQQPRHGMPGDDNKEYISKVDAEIKKLQKNINDLAANADYALGEVTNNINASLKAFSDSSLTLQLGLNKLIGVFDQTAQAGVDYVKASTWLEQRNKELNKSFKLTSNEAAPLGQAYDKMSESLGTGGEQVRKYAQNIDKLLPGMSKMITGQAKANNFNKDFRNELFMTNAIMTDHLGMSEEAANKYQMFAAANDKSSMQMLGSTKAFADQFEKSTGLGGQFGTILEGVSNLSEDVAMHYRKVPGSLQLAVVKAKLLGIEFSKIDAVATKMLDIESSVNDELEYQLLSGKRLVDQNGESITQKLRMAKLSGDANAATEAMNELLESQGDVLDGNNYYAKEQLAKLTGMTVQELTRANNMKKMQERSGMKEGEMKRIMELDPAEFAKATEKMNADDQQLFQELRAGASLKSTDELLNDLVAGKRTLKVVQVSGDQAKEIEAARVAAIGADAKGGDVSKAITDTAEMGISRETAELVGKTQGLGAALDMNGKQIENLTKLVPGLNTTLTPYLNSVTKGLTNLTGYTSTMTAKDLNATTTKPDGAAKDAVMVNDGVIQFHPADKFATVPDGAALLASTGTGQLASAVDSMTGGKTAVVDPMPIAKAVAAAIQSAMSGFKIELDGFNLAKAMEFSNRSLNG
jgi:hypothetical protein